jgi:hypothetical protein
MLHSLSVFLICCFSAFRQSAAVNDFGCPHERRSSSLAYALRFVNVIRCWIVLRLGMAGHMGEILLVL